MCRTQRYKQLKLGREAKKTFCYAGSKEKGFTMIFVMVTVIALSLLAVATMQSLNTETQVSVMSAEKKLAFSFAENTLSYVEAARLSELDSALSSDSNGDVKQYFPPACAAYTTDGGDLMLCGSASFDKDATVNAEAKDAPWLRKGILAECGTAPTYVVNDSESAVCTNGKLTKAGARAWDNPRYIIELVSSHETFFTDPNHVYRVTTISWGKTRNSASMLQAYYSVVTSAD